MNVLSFIGYPSYPGIDRSEWTRSEWNAYKVTMALKGAPFKGYADMDINGISHRITAENTRPVLEYFGQRVANLAAETAPGAAIFVLPSSGCTKFGEDAKAGRLAAAIHSAGAGVSVAAPFRWTEPMPKTAGGEGTRNANILRTKLRFSALAGVQRVILVDDVMTTGAHLRAAARTIRDQGITAVSGICFARTVWVRPEHIFNATEEYLNI